MKKLTSGRLRTKRTSAEPVDPDVKSAAGVRIHLVAERA
jgi:hypothetical protein